MPGSTWSPASDTSIINFGESLLATVLLRRYAPEAIRLRQPSDILALMRYFVLSVSVGAPIAAAFAASITDAHFWTVLRTWWASDVSGVILIAPMILALGRRQDERERWTPSRVIEGAAMLVGLVMTAWWIFLVPNEARGPFPQPFQLLPFLVWAAIRFGLSGTSTVIVLTAGFCVLGTHLGIGPYATADTLLAHLSVQAFACMLSVTFLLLATSVDSGRQSAMLHRDLVLQLQSAGEAERARLSHELHDDIAQKLAALKMQIELESAARPEPAHQYGRGRGGGRSHCRCPGAVALASPRTVRGRSVDSRACHAGTDGGPAGRTPGPDRHAG